MQTRFGLREDLLRDLVEVCRRHPSVRKLILFGSRARGTHRDRSDIDLAVEAEGSVPAAFWADVDDAVGVFKFDLVDLSRISATNPLLLERIRRDGVVLYERDAQGNGRPS